MNIYSRTRVWGKHQYLPTIDNYIMESVLNKLVSSSFFFKAVPAFKISKLLYHRLQQLRKSNLYWNAGPSISCHGHVYLTNKKKPLLQDCESLARFCGMTVKCNVRGCTYFSFTWHGLDIHRFVARKSGELLPIHDSTLKRSKPQTL